MSVALNIKNEDVERLVREVSDLTGDNMTETIRSALSRERDRLSTSVGGTRGARLRRFLVEEAWPAVPEGERGRRLTREEEDAILGYGGDGV